MTKLGQRLFFSHFSIIFFLTHLSCDLTPSVRDTKQNVIQNLSKTIDQKPFRFSFFVFIFVQHFFIHFVRAANHFNLKWHWVSSMRRILRSFISYNSVVNSHRKLIDALLLFIHFALLPRMQHDVRWQWVFVCARRISETEIRDENKIKLQRKRSKKLM